MEIAFEIAKKLLQIKAIKLSPQSPFTWASGLKSPIYCDNRIVLSHPDIRNFIIEQFIQSAISFQPFDTIAGVATAGIPHGALIADRMGLPFVYIRSKAKSHGRQNLIEGELKGGENVLVVEDLISTGGSCLQAVEALRNAQCEVKGVLAIFTYGFEQAKEAFSNANCSFKTLSNYSALLKEALKINYITSDEYELLKSWSKAPKKWSDQVVNEL